MVVYAGWELAVHSRTGSAAFSKLEGIQRISYDLVNDAEVKEQCGSRYPMTITEGMYGLTGTLERYYTGSGVWGQFGIVAGESALPWCTLDVYPNGSGSSKPFIRLDGVKMNKIGISHRPGSNLMSETWTFLGTGSIIIGTTGA